MRGRRLRAFLPQVDWEEFKGMFYRIRDDQSG